MNCRHCSTRLDYEFLDLGSAPPSNAYLTEADLSKPELYYPLKLKVCTQCWLVQTEDYARPNELFSPDYAYFSSTSTSWLAHAKRYCKAITERLRLDPGCFVMEVACNDGYLLRNFVEAGISCVGIEPTASTAAAAEAVGIRVIREFFGEALGKRLGAERAADLVIANNVFAHVPDINDFTRGLKAALKAGGTITVEFPHLMRLIENTQFDTVYHEHFSYLSLYTSDAIFRRAGLRIFDVEELPTHGGSLRVYAGHGDDPRPISTSVHQVLDAERQFGLQSRSVYETFQGKANALKNELITFLIDQVRAGKKVAAYGAAAKGCTLLNYAGIKPDLLPFVCDAAAAKQAKYLPGSHIPILAPAALMQHRPETVLILPWNLAEEVTRQHGYVADWGGRFAVAVPSLAFLS